jgi:5'-3' exonuclease
MSATNQPLTILVVDLSSLFRMAWEAAQGKELSAAFTRTIDGINAARVGFSRVVIACDSGRSFRRSIDPAYKANREDPGAAYREQLQRAVERLAADGCVIIAAPQVGTESMQGQAHAPYYAEADDVIGTVAALYRAKVAALAEEDRPGWWLTIYSGDGDMEQLVDDDLGIDVAKPPSLGGGRFTAQTVLEKRGVAPKQIVDLKALAGDASDNFKPFPGIMGPAPVNPGDPPAKRGPGIGDGAAVKLVSIFGGALAVFDDLDRKGTDGEPVIKPHLRKILDLHGRAAAERGLALATLKTDLPIEWNTIVAEPVMKPIVKPREFNDAPDIVGEPVHPAPKPVEGPTSPPTPSAALAIRGPIAVVSNSNFDTLAFQPTNPTGLWKTAETLFNSRVYAQFPNVESVFACIFEARERGVSAGVALRNAYIVKGKLAWSAAFMVALVKDSGLARVFRIIESTPEKAVLEYQHRDDPKPFLFEFTLGEAKIAGWLKSGEKGDGKWLTNPRSMLRWAAMREVARFAWPEVVAGIYTPDERRDGRTEEGDYPDEDAA